MLKKLTAIFIALTLCLATVACGTSTSSSSQSTFTNNVNVTPTKLAPGNYPVQQATYNDVDGVYTLMLLGANPPVYRTDNLQLARLTDEAIQKGEKTYLEVKGEQPVMYLTEDFKIEYVHNVTETQTNPQTGQKETVIVRQQSSFWAPFAGALAGQALGSLLFTPQYYVPPVYQPGGLMTGYGGYGNSYNQAVQSYQSKYNSPPTVEKNRQSLRTTGNLRTSSTTTRKSSPNTTKATGSGYGTSKLKNSGQSVSPSKSRSGFGSSSGSRNKSSFGSGAKRRR